MAIAGAFVLEDEDTRERMQTAFGGLAPDQSAPAKPSRSTGVARQCLLAWAGAGADDQCAGGPSVRIRSDSMLRSASGRNDGTWAHDVSFLRPAWPQTLPSGSNCT